MTALPVTTPDAPDDRGRIFDATADALAVAGTYAEAGARFAEVRDARGAAYAVRCASAALLTAAGLVEELRPQAREGRRS